MILIIGFTFLSLISVLSGFFTHLNIKHNNESFQQIIDFDTSRIEALLEMKSLASEIELNSISIQLSGNETQSETTEAAEEKNKLLASLELLHIWADDYESKIFSTSVQSTHFLQKIAEIRSSIVASSLNYINARELNESEENIRARKKKLNEDVSSLKLLIETTLLREIRDLKTQKDIAKIREQNSLAISILLSGAGFLITLLFWLFIRKLLVLPLRTLRRAAVGVSQGDFTPIKVSREDEIGIVAKSFNQMLQKIKESREKLAEEAEVVKNKTTELDAKVSELERLNSFMVNREIRMMELKKENALLKEQLEK